MFSLRVTSTADAALRSLHAGVADLAARLAARTEVPPRDFEEAMRLREQTHHLGECSICLLLY